MRWAIPYLLMSLMHPRLYVLLKSRQLLGTAYVSNHQMSLQICGMHRSSLICEEWACHRWTRVIASVSLGFLRSEFPRHPWLPVGLFASAPDLVPGSRPSPHPSGGGSGQPGSLGVEASSSPQCSPTARLCRPQTSGHQY